MMSITIKKQWWIGVAALVLAGCGQGGGDTNANGTTTTGTTPSGGAASANNDKAVEVAFVTNNVSDYWTIAEKGTDKANSELKNVTIDFKKPAQGTAAEQKQIIDDLISKGVQGIAISPVDPKNETGLINDTVKKNVLVFTQDSDAPESNRACYVGTDNVDAGKMAGQQILKYLPNGGKIMVFVGDMNAQNAKDRFAGVQEALKGSKVQILDVRTDGTDKAKAVANVSDALVKNPDLAMCVGLWSYNGPAILNALKQAKQEKKVKIVCFDEEDDTLQGVKDGDISATIVQQPFAFGEKAITAMVAYLRGDKSAIPADKRIIFPTKIIDSTTVDAFWSELKKLRGRA
jgi:ribose transport system substrate-binding protein